MLIVFVALIAAPLVVRRLNIDLPDIPFDLMQPVNQDNNDTSSILTGNNLSGGKTGASSLDDAEASSTSNSDKLMFAF